MREGIIVPTADCLGHRSKGAKAVERSERGVDSPRRDPRTCAAWREDDRPLGSDDIAHGPGLPDIQSARWRIIVHLVDQVNEEPRFIVLQEEWTLRTH